MTDSIQLHLVDDCLTWLKDQPDDSVDLIITSPPYEDARFYGIGFHLKGQEWVDWAVERFRECYRVSKGLTCWVIEGRTRHFQWSATPALFMADLHRVGVQLRKPAIYRRVGIPGSGGPDWWRNDYEFMVCATKGKLPWSDNTATGQPCKYGVGGAISHRTQDGDRINAKTGKRLVGSRVAKPVGGGAPDGYESGDTVHGRPYFPPAKANPGNAMSETYTAAQVTDLLDQHTDVRDCQVGGGRMGHDLAHENEAPFSEQLIEPFVQCFCPPGGIVLDPFSGSGTTLAVAKRLGRRAIGLDLRASQIALANQRVADDRYLPTLAV